MYITLNITNKFNTLVNYDYFLDSSPMKPVIFLSFPDKIDDVYEFEIMNFGLNVSDEMKKNFTDKAPYFEDIAKCNYKYQRIIIVGKAKFKITGLKGADLKFVNKDNQINGDKIYFTWPYKVERGDFDFVCGGYSSFSPHFITAHLIGRREAQVTLTFSSEDYVLIADDDNKAEEIAAAKQTPYCYLTNAEKKILSNFTDKIGRMFDFDFRNRYFDLVYGEHFYTMIATKNEE